MIGQEIEQQVTQSIILSRSEETINSVLENTVLPFITIIEKDLSKFDPLFVSRKAKIKLNDIIRIHKAVTLREAYDLLISDTQNLQNEVSSITLVNSFKNLKKPQKQVTISAMSVKFSFFENSYTIKYGKYKAITKFYIQHLTSDEMKRIASEINMNLGQKIAKAINS